MQKEKLITSPIMKTALIPIMSLFSEYKCVARLGPTCFTEENCEVKSDVKNLQSKIQALTVTKGR